MICRKCNTKLPDTAKFCLECGEPQQPLERANPVRWEICEIICTPSPNGHREWEFRAEAAGSNGKYLVSSPYISTVDPLSNVDGITEDKSRYLRHVLSSLVRALMSEGWEPLELLGSHWYSYRFRRRVT